MQFVSKFTENKMDGDKLERVYQKIKAGKASAAAVHNTGVGSDGEACASLPPRHCRAHNALTGGRRRAVNGLRENEDGELVDEEADDGEAAPDAKRVRHEDWEGERFSPPAWYICGPLFDSPQRGTTRRPNKSPPCM